MLSRKNRFVALLATSAVAAALALPAFAQALWIDETYVDPSGGVVPIAVHADSKSTSQTVTISYDSDGPAVSGPSSITLPAYSTSANFNVTVGPGESNSTVWVGMKGPTTQGACYIYVN
jgi:hypothetical protein